MEMYRLLITELTEYGDRRCVAGWDIDRKNMIRPEPHPAGFWPRLNTVPNKPFLPGNIVKFSASRPVPATKYPHLNEDRVVEGTVELERKLDYTHEPILAPTDDILKAYKKREIDWATYEKRFLDVMKQRRVEERLKPEMFEGACLLCSEATPHQCHRRLVCEYLNEKWAGALSVRHL